MKNLEQFKLIEKIKLSYLKTRGDVLKISNDLNLPVEYVKKIVKKFKGKESKDIKTLISHNLASHILFGYESRIAHMVEMLHSLEGKDKCKVSLCCEAPVRRSKETEEYGYEDYECLVCHLRCEVKEVPQNEITDLKLKILKEIREEDKLLTDFAVKMGYSNTVSTPQVIQKNNILVVGDSNKNIHQKNPEIDKDTLDDYSKLPPMEKEKLVEKLRARIMDIDERLGEGEIIEGETTD